MSDLWDKPITAGGSTATPEQLRAAWEGWTRATLKSATTLATHLSRVGVTGSAKFWPTAGVADRMLQRARRAGVIRYVNGRWEIVP